MQEPIEHQDAALPLAAIGAALVLATDDDAWATIQARLIKGGKSNLTYELTSAAGQLILRRPPLARHPVGAHDMKREVRVLTALADSPLPVPEVILCDAGDLLGVECYVMQKVTGQVIQEDLPPGYADSDAEKERLAHALIDTLAMLHKVDATRIGLGDFGRPDGYLLRQVVRWTGAWAQVKTHDVREVDLLSRALQASMPTSEQTSIVHGDFRIDNCLMSTDLPIRVAAVLDWEMSTLGDPLADLGTFLFYWRHPDEPASRLASGPSRLPGFPSRADLVQRYAELTGATLDHLAFYQSLACFKLAVIAQDIVVRGRSGVMADQAFDDIEDEVQEAATIGLDLLDSVESRWR